MSDFEPIEIDWTKPVDDGFTMPAPGLHAATVKKVTATDNGQPLRSQGGKGDRMLKLEVHLDESKYRIFDYVMLEGRGRGMGIEKLNALGFKTGDKLIPREIEGRRFEAETFEEVYNGKPQLKIKLYHAIVSGDEVPNTDEAPW